MPNKKNDILNIQDIKVLVDVFYTKVRQDELLSPIFSSIIQNKWSAHLQTMYNFWQTLLLGEKTYYGSPFGPHSKLPVERKHFDRWLKLFFESIDEQFIGAKADEAKTRAEKMSQMFLHKIEYYKNSSATPIV
jgi:hemoglobin